MLAHGTVWGGSWAGTPSCWAIGGDRREIWRDLIWKVWEVDPLRCPKCDGEMKVIALIEDETVVRKILDHLDLWQIRSGDERGTASEEEGRVEPDWVCPQLRQSPSPGVT